MTGVATARTAVRHRIRVTGVVQGVGFRPFVHRLATELGLAGHVGNDTGGVFVEVEGQPSDVARFERRLLDEPPPMAHISGMEVTEVGTTGEREFRIVESDRDGRARTFVSPDVAVCDDCLAELFDPADRRYRYPFINCTNCGPRFTITLRLPYDRPNTTMRGFKLCPACAAEYADPVNRRFHAQPVACPACGPEILVHDRRGGQPRRWDRPRHRCHPGRPGRRSGCGGQGLGRLPPGVRRNLGRRGSEATCAQGPGRQTVRRNGPRRDNGRAPGRPQRRRGVRVDRDMPAHRVDGQPGREPPLRPGGTGQPVRRCAPALHTVAPSAFPSCSRLSRPGPPNAGDDQR